MAMALSLSPSPLSYYPIYWGPKRNMIHFNPRNRNVHLSLCLPMLIRLNSIPPLFSCTRRRPPLPSSPLCTRACASSRRAPRSRFGEGGLSTVLWRSSQQQIASNVSISFISHPRVLVITHSGYFCERVLAVAYQIVLHPLAALFSQTTCHVQRDLGGCHNHFSSFCVRDSWWCNARSIKFLSSRWFRRVHHRNHIFFESCHDMD